VVVAACSVRGLDGRTAVLGMLCLDEIRGRLAEVFALKNYRIDHVVHGAIASAAVYGALLGGTAEQIESAIGMTVAHYIPWRAIRAGHQLSDSKGASAALSSEVAVLSAQRALRGFQGPKDIFRNPESVFRQFVKTQGDTSPFDLALSHSGDDFAVMGMHFKLGLYEHQSAGGLQGLIDLLTKNPQLLQSPERIKSIKILAYQPAFGIIGDPEKRDPHTRQSADHSMVYIMSAMLHKALRLGKNLSPNNDEAWKQLMLTPDDYGGKALFDPLTRSLMAKIDFEHGGKEYDDNYPDGIPTSVVITDVDGKRYDSGFVMYPAGHARNRTADLDGILSHKFNMLASYAGNAANTVQRLRNLQSKTAQEIAELYNTPFVLAAHSIDEQHIPAKL
jgi:2-methylcitrate dehydratase